MLLILRADPSTLILYGIPGRTRTASYPLGGDCIIQLCNGDFGVIIAIILMRYSEKIAQSAYIICGARVAPQYFNG